MDRIRDAVREAGIFIVLGYSERDNGSLYIAQVSEVLPWALLVDRVTIHSPPPSSKSHSLLIFTSQPCHHSQICRIPKLLLRWPPGGSLLSAATLSISLPLCLEDRWLLREPERPF